MTVDRKRMAMVLAGLLCWGGAAHADLQKSIQNSKHNLSASGPGSVRSGSEAQICIFCHTPHQATSQAPLWNRYDSGQTYALYSSTTAKALVGQPTGASKLCLSCHDGTVALGMVRSRADRIPMLGGVVNMPGGKANLGTRLSDDHPVSFSYDAALVSQNGHLKDPATLAGDVRLDHSGQVQCTSCHDPHHDDNGDFLNVDGKYGELCVNCHDMPGWSQSAHRTSPARWNGVPPNPWPVSTYATVAENGCGNCHQSHGAPGAQRLLGASSAEQNCLKCHSGHVARANIAGELSRISVHPVMTTGRSHDAAEPASVSANRHATCADCHDPHSASEVAAGGVPGALRGVRGIDRNGAEVAQVNYGYEVCFRCHAESNGGEEFVPRHDPQPNVRLEFSPSNASYHPVVAPGKNQDVPGLIAPLTTASVIECTSCHNNSQGTNNGGSGPRGPHGSEYAPLLERRMTIWSGYTEGPDTYALCYKCHDRATVLGDQGFPFHRYHVQYLQASCTACHDPHGSAGNPFLINFDRNIVGPGYNGQLYYEKTGPGSGECFLSCHNEQHGPMYYWPGGGGP